MPATQPQQVKEINVIIEAIEKAIKPKQEIGSQNKVVLQGLIKTHKISKTPLWFKTKQEYADQIVNHFVTEKKLVKNKFHRNGQEYIYLL